MADFYFFVLLMLYCSASLMFWSEGDGFEISYPCGNHLSMGSIATNGTIFTIIELCAEVSFSIALTSQSSILFSSHG